MPTETNAPLVSLYRDYQNAIETGIIEEVIRTGELYFTSLHGDMTREDREQLQKDVLMCAEKRKEF